MRDNERRAELTAQASLWVFENGLHGLALRPLAKALGTSDRMLLYYFSSKDDLLESIVSGISAAMIAELPAADAKTPNVLRWLTAVWGRFTEPSLRPALNLLFELDAMALRGDPAAVKAARGITEAWTSNVAKALAQYGVPTAKRASLAELASSAFIGLLLNHFLRERAVAPKTALADLARLIEQSCLP